MRQNVSANSPCLPACPLRHVCGDIIRNGTVSRSTQLGGQQITVTNTMIQAVLQPRPLPMKVSYVHLAISLLNAAAFSEVINFTVSKSSETATPRYA